MISLMMQEFTSVWDEIGFNFPDCEVVVLIKELKEFLGREGREVKTSYEVSIRKFAEGRVEILGNGVKNTPEEAIELGNECVRTVILTNLPKGMEQN